MNSRKNRSFRFSKNGGDRYNVPVHRQSLISQAYTKRIADRIVRRFLPNSYARLSWDGFIFLVVWYNAVITPIRIFIMSGDKTPEILTSLDVVFDFIFVTDTILRFYWPYVDKNTGQIVMDPQTIRARYRRSLTFLINVVACIPIIKLPISPFLSAGQQITTYTYVNVLRMIRLFHIPGQFQELKRFLERKEPVNAPVFRMYILLFFMLLFMCECGCLYFGLATLLVVDDICPPPENFVDEILGKTMWVARDSAITDVMDTRICEEEPRIDCDDCPQTLFTVRSLYFLMQTIFTIGYGDAVTPSKSTVEMALACAFLIFGISANSTMNANMTSALANLDVVNVQFRQEMDTVSRWLTLRLVPVQLRQRVTSYFSHLSRLQHGMLDEVLLGDLPPRLSIELAELHIDMLTKVPFFKKERRSEAFISMIATSLKRRIFPPQTFIFYQGEMQRELVIIQSGKADIRVGEVADSVGLLLPGDFIGDYQLLFGTKNHVGIQTADFTETLVLTFHAFKQVMIHPLNLEFSFSSLGHTFRQSNDEGCLETIEAMKVTTKKYATTATTFVSGKGRGKFNDMMAENAIVRKEFTILPNSRIHLCWGVFSLAAILYYAIVSPVRIATYHQANALSTTYESLFIIDYCIDVLFIVDMILRSTVYSYSSYENGKSVVVSDRASIRRKYLSSEKFKIDLLAVLPFDMISAGTGSYHVMFRLSKLIRVFQIPQVISNLQEHLDTCLGVTMNETQRSVFTTLSFYILFVVWSSSGWNALRPGENAIISVYWAITTISTVGYGDVVPLDFNTTCFCILIGAVGAGVNATVVGKVTSFFNNGEPSENSYEHKLKCIKRYMDRHKIPNVMSQKVIEYFGYAEQEQDGLNEAVLLRKAIPDHMAKNMLVHITQPLVCSCDFFYGCESGLIRAIMTSMEQVFYGANYMILTQNVPSDSMYFIKKGKVELIKEDTDKNPKVIRKLRANDSFAEGCLIAHWTSNPFLARTATECELWVLKRSVFYTLLHDYPRSHFLLRQGTMGSNDVRRQSTQHDELKAAEIAKRKQALYIHPHSEFMQGWFGLILGLTLYSMIAVPFRVSFLENHDISRTWVVLDYFGDIIFFADFVFRAAFLAFYDENNNLIIGHRDIWDRHVQSGKVKWQLLCALPIEALVIVVPTLCPFWRLQTWSLLRTNKLLRAIEVPYLIERVESSLTKAGVKVIKNPLKVLMLLLRIFLLAHLNACVFFAIANFNQHANSGNVDGQHNWANSEGLLDTSPQCPGTAVPLSVVSQQYTAALYWAMATVTTVGYGDVTADLGSMLEILYSTLILIVGMLVYAFVIASLTEIVSQLDVTSSLYKKKTNDVNAYAQIRCLPEPLKAKIAAYYEQLWSSHLGIKGEKLMGYIPSYLKSDLISEMTSPFILKTFFVKDFAGDAVAGMVRRLNLEIYLPGDCLFRHGERCDVLYFIYNGSIDLLTEGSVKFKTVSSCVLGESSFFMFEPHICTAKTAAPCEIFHLCMKDFLSILDDYQLATKFKEYLSAHHSELREAKLSIKKTIQNLSSSKMVRFLDTKDDVVKISKGVILPDSKIRVVWDISAFFALLYLITSIPMELSFASESQSIGRDLFLVDLILDAFFLADIWCRLRKFAIVKDGFLISAPNEFWQIYRRDEFSLDMLSAFPASFVAYCTGATGRWYGIFRLVQLLRAVRFGKYLDDVVEIIHTKTRFVVTTAALRVFQIFMTILVLSHWFSCVLHFIGSVQDETIEQTWLVVDGMQDETIGRRYLRSFFWSLYTITTTGYGSVPIVTIPERVFAMMVMAVGAVICDAGLTAVLSSIVANKDRQAGMNNRRIQCSKLFMSTNNVEETLQMRILEYYAFADNEMENIYEGEVLGDLSSTLAVDIVSHFCFYPLRECRHFEDYSDGAIFSLIKALTPYIAVPGEELSEIGKECHSLYVFQQGSIRTKDATGMIANVAEGTIIGHLATSALYKCQGLPTHELRLELFSTRLARSKYSNLYVILGDGRTRCRSSLKNTRNWMEKLNMKVILGSGKKHNLEITVKELRKRLCHATIGSGDVVVSESSSSDIVVCAILDEKGRNAGSIQLRAMLRPLSEAEKLTTHELTATALTFSHLYRLDVLDDQSLAQYISKSKCLSVIDRIPINDDGGGGGGTSSSTATTTNPAAPGAWDRDTPSYYGDVEVLESGNAMSAPNVDSVWEDPIPLKSIPAEDVKRRSFFVEWADRQNVGNG
jgi:CRP-like cAMP-binding protein